MQITSVRADTDNFGSRTLSGLMGLYESNHARMYRLLGGTLAIPSLARSCVADEPPLTLEVLERARYTTTFHLTWWFDEDGVAVPDPDLHVRVYHDARVAETIHCGRNRHWHLLRPYQVDAGSEIRRRWQLNLLLNKWLEYCLTRGYRFNAA